MKYDLSISLTEEQNDALLATVAEITVKGGNTTAEQLLRENGTNYVAQRVAHYYSAAMQRLGTAAAALPYAERKELIAEVEAKLA